MIASVVSGNIAYVAAEAGGLRMFDVSTPSSPVALGNVAGTIVDVVVVGSTAYIVDLDIALKVVDVSNPNSPSVIGSLSGGYQRVEVAGTTAFLFVELPVANAR